jgi:urea transporter
MQIDQWELIKAMFNGFANVFLNPRIMIPFFIGLLIIFIMKKGFKKLEEKIKNRKKS